MIGETETVPVWLWRFLTEAHAPGYVVAALVVCAVSAALGFRSMRAWREEKSRRRLFWLILGVASFGAGAWSTHFFAMLGWRPDLALGFDAFSLVASASLALAAVGPALFAGAALRSRAGDALGGLGATGGLGAMHYVGVAGVAGCAVEQGAGPLATAAVLGALLGAGALAAFRRAGPASGVLAAGLQVVSVGVVHFGALAGARVGLPQVFGGHDLPRAAVEPVMLFLAASALGAFALVAWAQTRADAERTRLAAIATHTQNGVLMLDAAGRIEWANPAFSGVTGIALRAVKGRPAADALCAPGAASPARVALEAALASGRLSEIEIPLSGPRGETSWAQVSTAPVADYAGVTRAIIMVLNDVTELKEREADLAAALRRAERASRAKSEFISVMSHELRTPLNGVLGLAALIGIGPLTPAQREQLAGVRASGERLLRVLNDILEFSADAGDAAPRAPFSPADLLDAITPVVGGDAAAKGLRFSARLADDLPERVMGDADTLGRVLLRLADNAVKFTEKGDVELALRTDPLRPGALVCAVRDTGPGLPPGPAEALFEGFAQGDSSATRAVGGMGLGLALCRRGAQRLGGWIEAESAPGRGATFRVVIPAAFDPVALDPAAAAPLPRAALSA